MFCCCGAVHSRVRSKNRCLSCRVTNSKHGPSRLVYYIELYTRFQLMDSIANWRFGTEFVRLQSAGGKKAKKSALLFTINACFACYKSIVVYSGYFVYIMTMMFTWTASSFRSLQLFFLLSCFASPRFRFDLPILCVVFATLYSSLLSAYRANVDRYRVSEYSSCVVYST